MGVYLIIIISTIIIVSRIIITDVFIYVSLFYLCNPSDYSELMSILHMNYCYTILYYGFFVIRLLCNTRERYKCLVHHPVHVVTSIVAVCIIYCYKQFSIFLFLLMMTMVYS